MALEPPGDTFLIDTITVNAPATGVDADGSPLPDPGAAGSPLACRVSDKGASTYQGGAAPFGTEIREVGCAANPAVVAANQQVLWTHRKGVAFAVPIVMLSLAEAVAPGGANATYRIYVAIRA